MKSKLNERVVRFLSPHGCQKKHCGDLGEFIINMFLSDYSYMNNETLKQTLVKELFARQIFWIEKNMNCKLENILSPNEQLAKAFEGGKTSNHLFVFNIEMAKFFINDYETKICILDESFGFLPDHVIDAFQKRVVQIKSIANFSTFMAAISYTKYIRSTNEMSDFLISSKKLARQQDYIK